MVPTMRPLSQASHWNPLQNSICVFRAICIHSERNHVKVIFSQIANAKQDTFRNVTSNPVQSKLLQIILVEAKILTKFGHCKLQSSRARRLTLTMTTVVYKKKPIVMDKIMDQLVQGKIANWDFQQVSTPVLFIDKTIHVPFDCSEPKIKRYIKPCVCNFLQFCCPVLESFFSFFSSCLRRSAVENLTAAITNNQFKELLWEDRKQLFIITDISSVL